MADIEVDGTDDSPDEVGSYQPTSNPQFKNARDTMSRILRVDEGLYESYRANVAMMLYDSADRLEIDMGGDVIIGRDPLDLHDVDSCNDMAERLIKLIFDS